MAENRAVIYKGPCRTEIEDIGYPKMLAKGKLAAWKLKISVIQKC
jgi:hypothetical protein